MENNCMPNLKCPIATSDAEWIENRWQWLTKTLGEKTVKSAIVVLPTPEYFPDLYTGTTACAERMLHRLAEYMSIPPGTVELRVYSLSENNSGVQGAVQAAGLYWNEDGQQKIAVDATNLADPLALAATLAHELGHVRLLGDGLVSEETEDHEPLTDLLTVWLGLGVITANAVIREHAWSTALVSSWSTSRRGYLSLQMYGYALACFAETQGDVQPEWARSLRPDVRQAFNEAVRYRSEVRTGAAYDSSVMDDQESSEFPGEAPRSHLVFGVQETNEATDFEETDEFLPKASMTAETLLKEIRSGRRQFNDLELQGLQLSGAVLAGCSFRSTDLSQCDFTNADLSRCDLTHCDLADATLRSADLQKTILRFASFRRADLSDADLRESDVRTTDFRACLLNGSDFSRCQCDTKTNLTGAETSGAKLDSSFRFRVLGETGPVGEQLMSTGRFLGVAAIVAFLIVVFGTLGSSILRTQGVTSPLRTFWGVGACLLAIVALAIRKIKRH